MINFIFGIIFTLIVVAIPYISYNLGKKSQRKSKSNEEIDYNKEQEKKEKEQGFYNVFVDYDIDVAAGRRKQR